MRTTSETAPRRPGASDPASAEPATLVALRNAAGRLAELLDKETAALRNRQPIDLSDCCDRKNQSLLELSRIGRKLDRDAIEADLRPVLEALRRKLDENSAALSLHLRAAQDVADLLTTALRDAESDGTYSNGEAPGTGL